MTFSPGNEMFEALNNDNILLTRLSVLPSFSSLPLELQKNCPFSSLKFSKTSVSSMHVIL
jgi:hypothetical protein